MVSNQQDIPGLHCTGKTEFSGPQSLRLDQKYGQRQDHGAPIPVEDPHPIAGGSPGLIGYSPVDIYYDNIKVTVNE